MAEFFNVRAKKIYSTRVICLEKEYFKLYRFREESVEWLAEYFIGNKNETRGGALTPKKQFEVFLRFLSDPGFQIGVGKEEGVHRSTVCKIVKIVLTKILAKAHFWIKFPKDSGEIKVAQDQWTARFNIPFAIGAIDCTHVAIQKPTIHGDEYINRKGYCSINVQATCNANEEFTSIDARWPGSVHDSRILKRSKVFEFMNGLRSSAILLGDAGYGIRPWLITPFKTANSVQENTFNIHHAKNRVIIERCFGQIKRRFPILQYKIRVDLNKVSSVIVSCAVLHNISKFLKDTYHNEEEEGDIITDVEEEIQHSSAANDNQKILGERRRRELANILQATASNTS